ncbi:NAD(P)-binding domain-containing protein [Candidatus Levibacter sp. Uisw_134_01]|jgi:3-hydroxyisobutyrate dehydrogenase-like beta-hydroxyacid dehydrogenase|uniref:NAD(P)-dependent oxidoreductase n=1 Tax=Candidatus Levibacter sp. Uisw_134_01 TaxID=3230999 RepID=UPI003D53AE24
MSKILNSTIGIAGCGTMGLPMLEVLLKNNINAFGYDIISKESFSSLENNFISSKKDFFQKVDVIFSVVRDINQTKELCEGKNGLFQLNSPKTLIISSTLSPAFLNHFFQNAPENITMIEAPMSGAPMKAKDATLTFMVGAEKNQYENILPILNILGEKIHHIGKFGSGMSVKVLNNFVASCSVVAVRHVLSEAKYLNISSEQLLEILNCSSGKTWFSENIKNIDWAKESYTKENTIGILEKDVNSFLDGLENSESETSQALLNFQKSLLNSLRNIPKFPNED